MSEDRVGGYWFPTSDSSKNKRMTPVWVEATRTLFESHMPFSTKVASILQARSFEVERIRILTDALIEMEKLYNGLAEKTGNTYGTVKFEPILDLDKCDEINNLLKSIEEGTYVNS